MHEQSGAGVGRRVEPGQAFHRALRILLDVDDDVAPFVLHAFQLQSHRLAHRAATAVAGDQPVGAHGPAFAAGLDFHGDAVGFGPQADDTGRPLQRGQSGAALHGLVRVLLDAVLLDIDHGRVALQGIVRHFEMQDFAVAKVAAPAGPGQPGRHQGLVGADPSQDFLRTPRHADGAAAGAIAVVCLHGQRGDAVFGQ
ncbi:hypothetical protein D3C72_1641940 [compost metagenome]